MVRKSERVIGTLLVWIGVLVSLSMMFDRLNYARVMIQNNWYYSGGVVMGAESTEAGLRILEDHQHLSQEIWMQVNQFAQAELLTYFPYLLLIGAALLLGGVLSTMFIWRSVVVPQEVSDMIAEKQAVIHEAETARSLSSLLDDDGEIADTNHQSAQTQRQGRS
jgi:hypothetical protein